VAAADADHLFVLVNAVINGFRMVDHVVVLTRGGPDNASHLLLYHMYEVASSSGTPRMRRAITVVLVVVLASVALFQFFVLDKRVHYK
jgi:sn-glycerol 3-phosphate transport system permease protein